jgi:hypothetical protein
MPWFFWGRENVDQVKAGIFMAKVWSIQIMVVSGGLEFDDAWGFKVFVGWCHVSLLFEPDRGDFGRLGPCFFSVCVGGHKKSQLAGHSGCWPCL